MRIKTDLLALYFLSTVVLGCRSTTDSDLKGVLGDGDSKVCDNLEGGEYVFISANVSVDQEVPFCVMKFEAKKAGNGKPISTSENGHPWQSGFYESIKACQSLGNGYQLVKNSMWQAIAREIETAKDQSSGRFLNWNLGRNYQSAMNVGIGKSLDFTGPARDYVAVQIDLAEEKAPWSLKKRNHRLENGQYIWDMAGNLEEWVTGASGEPGQSDRSNGSVVESSDIVIPKKFKPTFNYKIDIQKTPGVEYAVYTSGLGYHLLYYGGEKSLTIPRNRMGTTRGGSAWNHSGIFSANVGLDPDKAFEETGFRCARELPSKK